jgi:hypothetical protein
MIAPTVTVNMLIYIRFTLCPQPYTRYAYPNASEGF